MNIKTIGPYIKDFRKRKYTPLGVSNIHPRPVSSIEPLNTERPVNISLSEFPLKQNLMVLL